MRISVEKRPNRRVEAG